MKNPFRRSEPIELPLKRPCDRPDCTGEGLFHISWVTHNIGTVHQYICQHHKDEAEKRKQEQAAQAQRRLVRQAKGKQA